MSGWLIAIVGFIYLWICIEQAYLGQWGLSAMYFGYAFANVGAYLIVKGL